MKAGAKQHTGMQDPPVATSYGTLDERLLETNVSIDQLQRAEKSSGCCQCECARVVNHFFFFAACCGFVVFSSLPRIMVVADGITTTLLFFLHVRQSAGDHTSWHFVEDQLDHFDFKESVVDVWMLSIVRSLLLFFVFAYRYHKKSWTYAVSTTTMLVSIVYVSIKVALCNPVRQFPFSSLLYFNLAVIVSEYVVYMGVRRKRITSPDRSGHGLSRVSVDTAVTHRFDLAKDKTGSPAPLLAHPARQDQFIRLAEDGKSPLMRRVQVQPNGEGVEPMLLAEPDSNFMRVDNLLVHYKLMINGKPTRRRKRRDSAVHITENLEESDFVHVDHFPDRGNQHLADATNPSSSSTSSSAAGVIGKPGTLATALTEDDASPIPNATIILLHGFGGGVFSWKMAWKGLAECGRTVLAFDRPGFGLTSRPLTDDNYVLPTGTENPYSNEYQVQLTCKLMDRLHISEAIFVGHSTGGSVAMRIALRKPHRVRGLILLAPTIFSEGFSPLVRSMLRTQLGKHFIDQLLRSELGEVAIRRAWHDPEAIPEDLLQHYQQTVKVKNFFEGLFEMAAAQKPLKIVESLGSLTVPILVLHGAEDKIVPFSDSQKLVNKLQHAQLQAIGRCGHAVHEEMCHVFVDHVLRFAKLVCDLQHNSPVHGKAEHGDQEHLDQEDDDGGVEDGGASGTYTKTPLNSPVK